MQSAPCAFSMEMEAQDPGLSMGFEHQSLIGLVGMHQDVKLPHSEGGHSHGLPDSSDRVVLNPEKGLIVPVSPDLHPLTLLHALLPLPPDRLWSLVGPQMDACVGPLPADSET